MTVSVKSAICDAMLARLALMTEWKYKSFDLVKLESADFATNELPAIQMIDLGEINTHEMRRGKKQWNVVLEIIIGPDGVNTPPTQKDLWDLMQKTEETLWAVPNLWLPTVTQMVLLGSSTDLHLLTPLYLGRIEMLIEYYQPLVGSC